MKKIVYGAVSILLFIVLLGSCVQEDKGQLTRIDVQYINPNQDYGDVIIITATDTLELIELALEGVKWEPNAEPKMDRKADVKATLFFKFDKNMPERLYEYKIWFNKKIGTAAILSDDDKEGYGELDKENTDILKSQMNN
nr:hypothetical protein [Neobacillus sp. Marseille-Q6967]